MFKRRVVPECSPRSCERLPYEAFSSRNPAWSHQRREGGGCWGRCAVGVIRILAFQHKEFCTVYFKAWVSKREDLRFFHLVLAVK